MRPSNPDYYTVGLARDPYRRGYGGFQHLGVGSFLVYCTVVVGSSRFRV